MRKTKSNKIFVAITSCVLLFCFVFICLFMANVKDAYSAEVGIADGWHEEAGKVQYYKNGSPITGWLVDDTYKDYGLQRYFLGDDTYLVKSRSISEDEGGFWAYARPEGFVVRGVYDNGQGRVFLADNDGRLPESDGWLITDKYTNGNLERYYIDEITHGAKSSFFEVDNNKFYGEGGLGYVVRSNTVRQGKMISANNEGELLKDGWLITTDYGQGLQRYLFVDYFIPTEGVHQVGDQYTYVSKYGYVIRGVWDSGKGRVYLADNEGLLPTISEGWIITDQYTNGFLERYYIEKDTHAAKSSFFEVNGDRYYGEGGLGYVVRSNTVRQDKYISANNDGKLLKQGWLITGDYGQGVQRYWFQDYTIPNEGYYLIAKNSYTYVTNNHYVLRGTYDNGRGRVFLGNNDGILASTPGWLVTSLYEGSLQRYYIDASCPAAISGFFTVESANYFGLGGKGYVLRGKFRMGGGILLADNEGKLESTEGWLITSKYDGTLERYRIDKSCNGHMGAHCGAFKLDGKLYYGRDSQGYVVRNDYIFIDGQWYHGDNDGVLTPSNPPWVDAMIARAQGYYSPTGMLILTDLTNHFVGVFAGQQGAWTLTQQWICSCGAPQTPTVTGVFSIQSRGYSFGHDGYTCYYWTQFYGDYLFHSVLYKQGTFEILDGRLGESISQGCIRLDINCARWINENVQSGTTVVIY